MRLRLEGGRRHHHARDRLLAPRIVADHVLDVVDTAEHGNVADRLAAIGHRGRQHADRPHMRDGAALDPAQQHLGVSGAADQERGRSAVAAGMAPDPRVAEIPIGKPQRAQERYLQKPEQDDRDLAGEKRAMDIGGDQDVVEHQERERQYRRGAQDVQPVGQRNETPFRGGQIAEVADHDAEHEKVRQDAQQQGHADIEIVVAVETQIEAGKKRNRRRQDVMQRNQCVA